MIDMVKNLMLWLVIGLVAIAVFNSFGTESGEPCWCI